MRARKSFGILIAYIFFNFSELIQPFYISFIEQNIKSIDYENYHEISIQLMIYLSARFI